MQVLCIGTPKPATGKLAPVGQGILKGEVYTSLGCRSIGCYYQNIDMWHSLQDRIDEFHVSLFIELPNQEGQVFSKKELIEA